MFSVVTPRLILAATPLQVIKMRLQCDDFTADVPVSLSEEGADRIDLLRIHFPPEWPGDAIALLPAWETELTTNPGFEMWGGTMIDRASMTAVGQMTLMPLQDQPGTAELGYGVNRGYQGQGCATESARALVQWAEREPRIRRIRASCLEENVASARVLEKVGFQPIGAQDDDEGHLILWERLC